MKECLCFPSGSDLWRAVLFSFTVKGVGGGKCGGSEVVCQGMTDTLKPEGVTEVAGKIIAPLNNEIVFSKRPVEVKEGKSPKEST